MKPELSVVVVLVLVVVVEKLVAIGNGSSKLLFSSQFKGPSLELYKMRSDDTAACWVSVKEEVSLTGELPISSSVPVAQF